MCISPGTCIAQPRNKLLIHLWQLYSSSTVTIATEFNRNSYSCAKSILDYKKPYDDQRMTFVSCSYDVYGATLFKWIWVCAISGWGVQVERNISIRFRKGVLEVFRPTTRFALVSFHQATGIYDSFITSHVCLAASNLIISQKHFVATCHANDLDKAKGMLMLKTDRTNGTNDEQYLLSRNEPGAVTNLVANAALLLGSLLFVIISFGLVWFRGKGMELHLRNLTRTLIKRVLPPQLSPFVDDEAIGYVPEYADTESLIRHKEIKLLKENERWRLMKREMKLMHNTSDTDTSPPNLYLAYTSVLLIKTGTLKRSRLCHDEKGWNGRQAIKGSPPHANANFTWDPSYNATVCAILFVCALSRHQSVMDPY
ncbi:hypothetical protein Tco_0619511 [Tanacetum coccineum]